jgi:hypothetical protein
MAGLRMVAASMPRCTCGRATTSCSSWFSKLLSPQHAHEKDMTQHGKAFMPFLHTRTIMTDRSVKT